MRYLFYLVALPAWAGAMFGCLQLNQADLGLGHGICGAWGCGPKVEALLGFHGFTLLLIVPFALLVGFVLTPVQRRIAGKFIVWAALLGIVVYMAQDGIRHAMAAKSTRYVFQRALFSVAVATDIPLVQTLIAGLVLRYGRWKAVSPVSAEEAEQPAMREAPESLVPQSS